MDRDPPLYEVFKHFGSAKKLADYLGISTQAVSHWKKVPEKYVYSISQATGIHPYKLRPDKYIEAFWMAKMDTELIAKAMFLEEAEVYRILNEVLERRRHKPNVETVDSVSPISEPPVESGGLGEGLSVVAVHNVAESGDVGDQEPDKAQDLWLVQTDNSGSSS
jgi:DNA-binding transcriptional regulator YdaS (Cro superfamily)